MCKSDVTGSDRDKQKDEVFSRLGFTPVNSFVLNFSDTRQNVSHEAMK